MTEWEKLQQGLPYDDFSKELDEKRKKAKKLFNAYNQTTDDDCDLREDLFKRLFLSYGKNLGVEPNFRCAYGKNITIGDNVYINFDCIILDCAAITIGDRVMFGPRTSLYAVVHAFDKAERASGISKGRAITIGNDVWIGGDVTINGGVSIGDGTIIGSGSVVTKDIPAGVVAVGNPCRVIRQITEKDKFIKNFNKKALK